MQKQATPRTLDALMKRITVAVVLLAMGQGRANANDTKTDKVVTYQIENTTDLATKGYAVFVNVAAKNIDLTATMGKILKKPRVSERFAAGQNGALIGTLIVFEDETGIPKGKKDDIQITFKDLPKAKADVKFSDVSTLRSSTGVNGKVSADEVPRLGFKVVKDPIYSILNDNLDPYPLGGGPAAPVEVTIHDLQYLTNVSQVVDTTPFLDFSNSYGFQSAGLSPFTVAGASESSPIQIPGPVDYGNWFYVRGYMTITQHDASGNAITSDIPFVNGQDEFVTPEPGTVMGAIIGVAGWVVYRRRTRR